jgi:hypothetical protein
MRRVPRPRTLPATAGAARKRKKIHVENLNHPGQVRSVDAEMYAQMKRALLSVVPNTSPGLTVTDIEARLLPRLPATLFPGGAKAGWWAKTVQLDLEAKGILRREKTKPLRLHRA